ncbi:hypothetical protein ACIBEF_31540 [Micromonospora sp. NPDC050795]|uniref:hypothetical protein n=1 Tax=Micromonospora sp. NPDC050795 TaxID=3364282 RepID=UPI003799166E
MGLLALVVLAPGRAAAGQADTYTIAFDAEGAQYHYRVCLSSDTTKRTKAAKNGDRVCTERLDGITADRNKTFSLTVPYTEGDNLEIDFEQFLTLGNSSRTKDDLDITGGSKCHISGTAMNGALRCDWPKGGLTDYTRPSIEPYTLNVNDPNEPMMKILNLMAWCVSAAAVAGLLITGTLMAMQLRHGVPGEQANEYIRPISLICGACVLAASAGPIVQFLGFDQ